jgi:hypothetical protein
VHRRASLRRTLALVAVWTALCGCAVAPVAPPATTPNALPAPASVPATAGATVAPVTATSAALTPAAVTPAIATPPPAASSGASLPPASAAAGQIDPECETYVTAAVVGTTLGRTVNSVRRSAQGTTGGMPDNLECAYDMRSDAGTNIQIYLDTIHEYLGGDAKVFDFLKMKSIGPTTAVPGLGLEALWVPYGKEFILAWNVQNDGKFTVATTYHLRGADLKELMKIAPLVAIHKA